MAMVKKKDMPQSPFGRLAKMGKLGMGLTGSYLGYQLQSLFLDEESGQKKKQDFYRKSAQRMKRDLSELKGPLMKLGQAISMQSHLLPQEVLQELADLHMKAPSMHWPMMRIQFKKSMGHHPEEIFASFEKEAFAAASLGQVHRARTKEGQEVAVKIQYPGIRQVIENDLKTLKAVLLPARARQRSLKNMQKEIEEVIFQEIDYENEAQNIQLYREKLKPLPYVRVPEVYPEYSSKKVLCMSLMPGLHLDEFLATKPSQDLKDRIGARLFELFYYQVYQMDCLHADPHLGNYLFNKDGSLNLIDFGCVKHFDPDFLEMLRQTFLKDIEESEKILKRMYQRGGLRFTEKCRQISADIIALYNQAYPREDSHRDSLVDFGDASFLHGLNKVSKQIISNQMILPEMFYFVRAEGGLYNILHKLGARVATSRIMRKCMTLGESERHNTNQKNQGVKQ
jgi:aarF domain-containing kinase